MIRTILVWLGSCVTCAIISSQIAQAQSGATKYHSDSQGYSITIPPGWKRIPDAQVRAMQEQFMTSEILEQVTMDLAIQKDSPVWFTYPYGFVQVQEYPTGRQFTERHMRQFIKGMTDVSDEDIRERMTEQARDIIVSVGEKRVVFSPETRTFVCDLASDVVGVGTVRARTYGWFGHRSIVLLAVCAPADEFDKFQSVFKQLQDSFQFDPGMEYQVVDWFASPAFAWTLIVAASSVIALVLRQR